jgi:5-(carboxyamino)imidazole ribonucleotide synthase
VAHAAVEAVGGVGIMGVELFEMEDGRVLVNELAPRPHNTGHYSIEACHTSQFENHVRAVLGLPLGDPGLRVPYAVMVNVLGQREGTARPEGIAEALAVAGASVHIYGKPDVRPQRKMGHVTVTGDDPADARRRAEQAAACIRL